VPEISFQAAIWMDAETGNFRLQIRPYAFNGARTYVAMMDSERLSHFVTFVGRTRKQFQERSRLKRLSSWRE
jgi:hypothetical protein